MIQIFFCFFAILFGTSNSYARTNYETPYFSDVLSDLDAQNVIYIGHARLHDFFSTETCVYLGEDFALLKHYCYPKRKYPARSFTIISKRFGTIYFYEEDVGADDTVRSLSLSNFASDVEKYFPDLSNGTTIQEIDLAREAIYKEFLPACWTSIDREGHRSGCLELEPSDFGHWFLETEPTVLDIQKWNELFEILDQKAKLTTK
ncbi:MAG: hypothetical protein KDD25_02655 [Bdellovibrionales bacterium]|nr:hypothetical protein [Bdellovibrionales bacterium]